MLTYFALFYFVSVGKSGSPEVGVERVGVDKTGAPEAGARHCLMSTGSVGALRRFLVLLGDGNGFSSIPTEGGG